MRTSFGFGAVVVISLSVAGCKSKSVDSAQNPTGSTVSALHELAPIRLAVCESDCAKQKVETPLATCGAYYDASVVQVHCKANSRAITLELAVGGQPIKGTTEGGETQARLSTSDAVYDVLGDLKVPPPRAAFDAIVRPVDLRRPLTGNPMKVALDLHATLMVTDGASVLRGTVAPFELSLDHALPDAQLMELARRVPNGLLFRGETTGDPQPPAHSVLYWTMHQYFKMTGETAVMAGLEVEGPATRVGDADWAALETSSLRMSSTVCAGYGPVTGNADSRSLPLWYETRVVNLYERRSGREIANKTFDAKSVCPKGADYAMGGKALSSVDSDAMRRWIHTEISVKPH
jgi:hypothetical protein